jgi:ABC-type multidrug transport system fused ATPase/permease subunit
MLKTFYTLFPELKNKLFILVFLSIFSSILDILSLGLIGPLIGMIVDKNFLLKFPIIYNFIEYLNIFNLNIFIFISFLILILFLIKSFFTYNIINFIHSFCFRQQVELRNKILRIYLSMPFIEFMKKDYSNKFVSLTELTRNVTENALINLLKFFSDLLICVGITFYLISINYKISLIIVLLLFFIYFFFRIFLKEKILGLGKKTVQSLRNILSNAQSSLSAVKEIKVFKKEKFFIKKMSLDSLEFSKAYIKHILISSLPKMIIENVLVFTMLIVLIFAIYLDKNTDDLFSLLAIFGFAAFRLGPLTHNILASYTQIWNTKFALITLEEQLNEFQSLNLVDEKPISNQIQIIKKVIEFKNCKFSYDNNKTVFNNLNFKLEMNKSFGISGASGSGKTTFLYLLMGLLKFDEGIVKVDDKNINLENYNIIDTVAYIPQETYLLDDTIKNNILFDSDFNQSNFNKVISDSKLQEVLDIFPQKENSKIGYMGSKLSGGQRQRISIARALYKNKKILILDEPTSSLDEISKKEIIDNIKNLKNSNTIIVISHDISVLENFESIYEVFNMNLKKIK